MPEMRARAPRSSAEQQHVRSTGIVLSDRLATRSTEAAQERQTTGRGLSPVGTLLLRTRLSSGNDSGGKDRTLLPIPASPEALLAIAERLGAIDAVKSKLVKRPDPAAAKLVTVLEELSKIYGAMEDELTTYLSLFFDDADPKQLARERAALARLEGGAIRARMEEARGRCSKIWNIYSRYLTPWFDRVLNKDESERLRILFRELSDVDSQMVDAINDIATWLTSEALATGDMAERNDFAAANARVMAARREVRPLRERIADAMIQIRRLERDFIEVSGAV